MIDMRLKLAILLMRHMLFVNNIIRWLLPKPGFTLDGRWLGCCGEAIVSDKYGIDLYGGVHATHDGITKDNKLVQIKCTMRNSLGISCFEKSVPDYYIGVKLDNKFNIEEIYNGPGSILWEHHKHYKLSKSGMWASSLTKIKKLNKLVKEKDRIRG